MLTELEEELLRRFRHVKKDKKDIQKGSVKGKRLME
jgi:hypothetical protein